MKATVDEILEFAFLGRTLEDKLRIVTEGKPRPLLNIPCVVTMSNNPGDTGELCTYQFKPEMYDEISWLTGCDKRQTFFCWPCLLFQPTLGIWNTTGIADLVYFMESKSKHEETLEHMQATSKLQEMIDFNTRTKTLDVSEHNEIVKRNRAILKRMIDVVCNLLAKEQPSYDRIRGCELDPENCVKNLKFLRIYDVLNCNYIEDAIDLIQITPNIVNDLVHTITKGMKMTIRKEVQQSTYVSVILSDHSKIAEKSQISTTLRYLKGGKVSERFIGFLNMGNQKSMATIYQHILNILSEFAIQERFLALALDGGIVRGDEVLELYVLLKNAYPFMFFVPWYCHGMEYVLQQSLMKINECRPFFMAVEEMKIFFQKKSKRFKAFETYMAGAVPHTKDNTKWFTRSQFIQVVNKYRQYIIQFFGTMLQSSTMWDPDDIAKALGFQQILEDFRTIFLLETFTKLFESISVVNKCLKSSSPEKLCTNKEVTTLIDSLMHARNNGFKEMWSDIHLKKNNEKTALPQPPSKRIKVDMEDPTVAEYYELYTSILNRVIQEIDMRYASLSHMSFCQLLICDKAGKFTFTNEMLQTLMVAHGMFFDEEQTKNELIVLRTNGTVFAKKSIYELVDFFIQSKLKNTFKYLFKLGEFILTLPLKPPSEDDSATKFKEIKDWSYIPEEAVMLDGDVSVPCVELEFLQEMKKSGSFHEEIAVIFYELNKTFELLHR